MTPSSRLIAGSMLFLATSSLAQVRINEFAAASSDKKLNYDANAVPRLGSTKSWYDPAFSFWTPWETGLLPAGWGVGSPSTNLQAAMQNKTHTLYLRKSFNVTAGQATSSDLLKLTVNVNDGFVAYINGVEVARANCGPAKHFMFAAQPAYNATSYSKITNYNPWTTQNVTLINGPLTFTLGPASSFLTAGANVIAVEAHNADLSSSFNVDVGLGLGGSLTGGSVVNLTFSNNAGANVTHTNTAGTSNDGTVSGTAASDGWLSGTPNPISGSGWTNLTITRTESTNEGYLGSGAMRMDLTQTGATPAAGPGSRADIYGKPVAMNGAWEPGAVNADQVNGTRLKFKYRLPNPDSSFDLRLDPGTTPGGQASALAGFLPLGQQPLQQADWTGGSALNGNLVYNMGTGGATYNGSRIAGYYGFRTSNFNAGQWTIMEDNALNGPDGAPGVLRFTIDSQGTLTNPTGDSWWGWGFSMDSDQFATNEWHKPNVDDAALAKTTFRFRYKFPAGRQLGVRLEPNGAGGYPDRLDFPAMTGTGSWETYSFTLNQGTNKTAFLAAVNNTTNGASRRMNIVFTNWGNGSSAFPSGTDFLLDDISIDYDRHIPAPADFTLTGVSSGRLTADFAVDPNAYSYVGTRQSDMFGFSTGDMNGGIVRLVEDETVNGPDGQPGVLKLAIGANLSSISTTDWWGYGIYFNATNQFTFTEWNTPNVTMADLHQTKLSFRWRFPLGKRLYVRLEPRGTAGGGYGDRCDLGTLVGTGQWETYTAALGAGGNVATFLAAINAASAKSMTLIITNAAAASTYTAGLDFFFDDISMYVDTASSPVVQAFEERATSFSGFVNGTMTKNVDNTVSFVNHTTPGCWAWSGPGTTGFAFQVIEDNVAGAGYLGSTGHARLVITDPADTGPDYWGAIVFQKALNGLPVGTATTGDLAKVTFQMAVKVAAGQSCFFWMEPNGMGYNERLELGTVNGTGNWQLVRWELNGLPNAAGFINGWNTSAQRGVHVNVGPSGANQPAGTQIVAWDDPQFLVWREFDSIITAGTDSSAFISAVNSSSISWLPVFSKRGYAAQAGESLIIDDFEVLYTGPLPGTAAELIPMGAAGGNWNYQVGLGEPSGGVYDPLLARGVLVVPEALREDYDNPAESVDWVELYNEGASPADISGYGFTDNLSQPTKWTFPTGTSIPAGGYLLVLADKRPLGQPPTDATYPHTNFSISSGGGSIGLFSGTTAVSTVTYPNQTADKTWSRDAGGAWGYTEGTPNQPNTGSLIPAVVANPDIFITVAGQPVRGGHFTGAQNVEITCATAGAEIRYTTNGSIPTATSTLYSGPIAITAPNAKTANVIRARAFLAGSKPSDYKTSTFLLDQDARLTGVPVVSFVGDAGRSMYGPHGIMTISGGSFEPLSAPTWDRQWWAFSYSDYNIAMADGDPAEREANLEWITPAGYYGNAQDPYQNVGVGLRLSWSPYSRPRGLLNNASSASPLGLYDTQNKNSYNIFFRSDFGPDNSISYRFFPNYSTQKFKNMRLRAGKNDIANPFYVDELMRRMWISMGNQGVRGSIVTNYVNGAYKGYYNLCERIRLPFYQEHFNSSNLWDVRYVYDWEEGDGNFYAGLFNQISNPADPNYDTSIAANYAVLSNRMDPVETADYFILNIWGSTWDWPWNNFAIGRERVTGPQGRFHWTVWDAEGALGNQGYYNKQADYNTIVRDLLSPGANGNQDSDLAMIFRSFIKSPQWRRLFADRVKKHFFSGGALDTTTGSSPVHTERNSLVTEVTPLWRYANNSTTSNLNENFWTIWLNGGNLDASVSGGARTVQSRRGYLFPTGTPGSGGYVAGWLRDPNQDGNISDTLWPATEAPVFNQNGGSVPGGFSLVMTSPSNKPIYYTTNGLDPATATGSPDPSATVYSNSLTLTSSVTVKARSMTLARTNGAHSPKLSSKSP